MFLANSSFPLHFETGKHPRKPVFLADEEYSKALDCLTKACTDLFLINSETKKVLLGKRKVHPQPDWWFGAGGRMKPGENCYESAARILKRELAFVLPPLEQTHVQQGGRFLGVGAYSFTWEMREQEPQTNGCADISVIMAIEVTPQEIATFKMDNQEYETHDWFEVMQVVNDETKHPALRRGLADYLKTREWRVMIAKVNPSSDDSVVGKNLKQFLTKWQEVDEELLKQQQHDGGETTRAEKRQRI